MVCHGNAFDVARRYGASWAGHSHRARASQASIDSMFDWSENAAIALASWATESLAK